MRRIALVLAAGLLLSLSAPAGGQLATDHSLELEPTVVRPTGGGIIHLRATCDALAEERCAGTVRAYLVRGEFGVAWRAANTAPYLLADERRQRLALQLTPRAPRRLARRGELRLKAYALIGGASNRRDPIRIHRFTVRPSCDDPGEFDTGC